MGCAVTFEDKPTIDNLRTLANGLSRAIEIEGCAFCPPGKCDGLCDYSAESLIEFAMKNPTKE